MEKKSSKTSRNQGTQIGGEEDDDAAFFIGSIIEKGMDDEPNKGFSPTQPPRPTVLPFPVARHRSHGPHWVSKASTEGSSSGSADDAARVNDEEESNSCPNYDLLASNAKPIQKKEKKSIDFSKWKDLNSSHSSSECHKEEVIVPPAALNCNKDVERGKELVEREKDFECDQGSESLKSEIDKENLARLHGMTLDEIAEARTEILEKFKPSLLEKLQKRRTNTSLKRFSSDTSDKVKKRTSSQAKHKVIDKGVESMSSIYSISWSAWSDRVEAVRTLRFSLNGSVIKTDTSGKPGTVQNASVVGENPGYTADNVTERDFLRTEGDPSAAGYTIKEAVALTRSVVPGQRALALHLLAAVLAKALRNNQRNKVGHDMENVNKSGFLADWEAVWAYALGPEPELVLSLRLCLDDNHNSVVLACAKVIHCILSCDMNENYFNILEKIAPYQKDVCIAPVFRTRPEIDDGFLHGGFWKYNTKPSNIFPYGEDNVDDENEEKHTIQDDVVISGQDIGAGLVRMGILPRICYLLESDPTVALEEYILSILIAVARHSPTGANAVLNCERLVETVVNRFTMKDKLEIYPSMIKSVILVKVLARYDRKICYEFIENDTFRNMTWHLYQYVISLEQWLRTGREACKLASALMVEQFRLWKVCIEFGYCISYYTEFFPALCLWLNPPTTGKLVEQDVLSEFATISKEAYLLLGALARRLPNYYSQKSLRKQNSEVICDGIETWSWSLVGPMIDLAVQWLSMKSEFVDSSMSPLLWVLSSVMHMLSCVLRRAIPKDTIGLGDRNGVLTWLTKFVPKIGLAIIKNGYLSFRDVDSKQNETHPSQSCSFIAQLCDLRCVADTETSLAAVCSLQGLVQVVASTDKLIKLAKSEVHPSSCVSYNSPNECKILEDGILKLSYDELRSVSTTFMNLMSSEWQCWQAVEVFGRGGPAPGVGFGWGSSSGGFWSISTLLAQVDAGCLMQLLEILHTVSSNHISGGEEMRYTLETVNAVLGVCLGLGPKDQDILEKAFNILFQVPIIKQLDSCARQFLCIHKGMGPFQWEYNEEEYQSSCEILASHFRSRWLCVKKKKKKIIQKPSTCTNSLDTIHEDVDMSDISLEGHHRSSMVVQWAHQRLPLPLHWFLSPISTLRNAKHNTTQPIPSEILDEGVKVAKCGLFFLLGLEGMSSFLSPNAGSPVQGVPLIWKLHSLSVVLFSGMSVIEEQKSRDVFRALQEVYGQYIHKLTDNISSELIVEKSGDSLEQEKKRNVAVLSFQSEIHDSYPTFIETLVEQFAAISYGDQIFGRQVAIYLHRCVEAQLRLSTWNALSNARVLELLPPLENCLGEAEGYLQPIEDNELILEAYAKSWTSGALDKAAVRGSVTFTLVRHHLSSFIFLCCTTTDGLVLRNKLVKSLLRDYSRNHQHEEMMLGFIQYRKPSASEDPQLQAGSEMQVDTVNKRLELLMDACEGNTSLLKEVERLRTAIAKHLMR